MAEPRTTILSLPSELLQDIIGYLWHSELEVTLRPLSLVAKAFARPVQAYLFHTLSVEGNTYATLDDFVTRLRGAPEHIRNAVRHFQLLGGSPPLNGEKPTILTQRLLAALLVLLPGLTQLTILEITIEHSPADEDDLARIGWGHNGKDLQCLTFFLMPHFYETPSEYVSILSLFHTIGTLHIEHPGHRARGAPTQDTSTLLKLDYHPMRSLGVQCAKLLTVSNFSWLALLSNTRSALGGANRFREEAPALREIQLCPKVCDIEALAGLLRLGGKDVWHVNMDLEVLIDDEKQDVAEHALLRLSLSTSCPHLNMLTLRVLIYSGTWQSTLDVIGVLIRSLSKPVDELRLILEIYCERDDVSFLQDLPELCPVFSAWLRGRHMWKARVIFRASELGDEYLYQTAVRAVEQLAAHTRDENIIVEWGI